MYLFFVPLIVPLNVPKILPVWEILFDIHSSQMELTRCVYTLKFPTGLHQYFKLESDY